jgi:hypothetical protein
VTYGEYQLHDLCCQVEHLHSQLNAAAHEAHYWANRVYTAEITNLNAPAVQVQRRHQPPTMQHSEYSETSPANADNAAAAVAAAALRAAADAASAAASSKDTRAFWTVLQAATTAAAQAPALSAPQSATPTHVRRGGRPPRGPRRRPRGPRRPRNQQPRVQHADPTANSPPGPLKVRAQHPGASFTSSNRAANAPSL